MASGSEFGKILRLTTWGESHGAGIGAVLDGFPAGMDLSEEDIQKYLDRRKPGQSEISTPRKESDRVEILSGVFDGKTTGTPISLLIRNTSHRSGDYGNLKDCFRPGHADYTYYSKYGFRDYRGGGRASARETAGRVAAGAIAAKFLRELGVDICAFTRAIGPVQIDDKRFDKDLIAKTKTCMPDAEADEQAMRFLKKCMEEKDSAGGVIECVITGVPAGIGDPVFDKLDAGIAQALMSIGAVKAVEIGDGVKAALSTGSMKSPQAASKKKERKTMWSVECGITDFSLAISHLTLHTSNFTPHTTHFTLRLGALLVYLQPLLVEQDSGQTVFHGILVDGNCFQGGAVGQGFGKGFQLVRIQNQFAEF